MAQRTRSHCPATHPPHDLLVAIGKRLDEPCHLSHPNPTTREYLTALAYAPNPPATRHQTPETDAPTCPNCRAHPRTRSRLVPHMPRMRRIRRVRLTTEKRPHHPTTPASPRPARLSNAARRANAHDSPPRRHRTLGCLRAGRHASQMWEEARAITSRILAACTGD